MPASQPLAASLITSSATQALNDHTAKKLRVYAKVYNGISLVPLVASNSSDEKNNSAFKVNGYRDTLPVQLGMIRSLSINTDRQTHLTQLSAFVHNPSASYAGRSGRCCQKMK